MHFLIFKFMPLKFLSLFIAMLFFVGAGQLVVADSNAESKQKISAVEKRLLDKITSAQKDLQLVEADTLKKSSRYSKKISGLQTELDTLRDKAASSRRLADEQTLTIKQLNKRLKEWRDQDSYQHHLLTNFASSVMVSVDDAEKANKDITGALEVLSSQLDQLSGLSSPNWNSQQVVGESGVVQEAQVLRLGPVSYYINDKSQSAGLLLTGESHDVPKAFELTEDGYQKLSGFAVKGHGEIQLDPTMGRAIQIIEKEESAVEHVSKGGIWAIPILFFALVALLIALVKGIQLLRLPKIVPMVVERITKVVESNSTGKEAELKAIVASTSGAQNKLLSIALGTHASEKRDDMLISFLMDYRHKLEKLIGVVAITASIAPLLGLLGTVSGMIETFKMMTIFGAGDPAAVSGGISEALVTTELGLIVAIPALVLNALLSRKIKSYVHHLESMAIKLSKLEFSK